MDFRNIQEDDYVPIISVIDDWWGGRHMADMLPRLFFQHFQDTSFVVTDNEKIVGFVVGFVSQTKPKEAYIHFAGIHPHYRSHGLARALYEKFLATVKERGCRVVRLVTAPMNTGSIKFHLRMGFRIEEGDEEIGGIQVKKDYDGPGQSRVRFALSFDTIVDEKDPRQG